MSKKELIEKLEGLRMSSTEMKADDYERVCNEYYALVNLSDTQDLIITDSQVRSEITKTALYLQAISKLF